jgi:AAA domain
VALCHDADGEGDAGAEKAARIIGGKTKRVRPPVEGGDWCDWVGGRDEFLALAGSAEKPRYEFTPIDRFLEHRFPEAEPILGEPGEILLALGSFFMVYGSDGSAKSTMTIDAVAHLAAGVNWLGIAVPRPVRICVIENEGPPNLFQHKLAAKIESWEGPGFAHNVFVFTGPWGEFSFADAEAREALVAFCEEHAIDLVVANPTLGLGVAASGRPDETQQFVDWLVECGLKGERAFWLIHHQGKSGAISGDWARHPDTVLHLEADGNRPRTKATWSKTRWATLPSETIAKACLLEWIVETQGYSVTDLDTVGASDSELEERIVEYLLENSGSTTNAIKNNVKGTNSRIRELLEGERFDCFEGKNRAKLWFVRTEISESENDSPTHLGGNADG